MANWLAQLFGSRNQRLLHGYNKSVARTNALENRSEALSDEQLAGQDRGVPPAARRPAKTVDDVLPEAFAAVREASRRTLGLRHFDVQLIGGMVLHQGKIAEMRTGEGKTLVATLPAYLNALPGKGVHVVTVNEYLAQRDADWMGAGLPLPRPDGRRDQERPDARREARGLRLRHHLRHQQRIRLRLPARQPRVPPRGPRAARPRLRDRRRSRLDPDRRSAHAADHLRSGGGEHRALRAHQRSSRRVCKRQTERGRRGRLLGRREDTSRCTCPTTGHEHVEELFARGRAAAAGREPVRRRRTSASCIT